MKQHPLAEPALESRLDILTGGTLAGVMNETVALLRQSVKKLGRDAERDVQRALVLNALVSDRKMEQALARWFDDEVMHVTYSPDVVLTKFEFLEHAIEERNVELLVIPSLEFLAVTPAARMQVLKFLKRLMMERDIRIVVMVRAVPRVANDGACASAGPVGLMAFIASSIVEIGWYLQKPVHLAELLGFSDNALSDEGVTDSPEQAEDFSRDEIDKAIIHGPESWANAESLAEKMPAPDLAATTESYKPLSKKQVRRMQLLKSGGRSLKNKELEVA